MAVVISPSEVQILLQIDDKYPFISDAIPIIQNTIDSYFSNTSWVTDGYPVSLKRPTTMLIKQLMDNPGAIWREEIGDDETEFRGVDLSKVFSGLDNLKTNKTAARANFFNLESINTNLGIPNG
ncbi:hypothetical protein LCGC14_0834140 [marine sediment metagenome]|uniref:Uncharacterized protein n=1 Tax=marine sediment metagenome TaxID=412755 RepID=A0A0F9PF53_9ZZZZ